MATTSVPGRFERRNRSQEYFDDWPDRSARKTEIARRLAKITESPFVKVEATKFTEVGFHGRDVDQIIRDLMDNAITLTKTKLKQRFKSRVAEMIENKILDFVCGESASEETREAFRALYREGALDNRLIEVEIPEGTGGNSDGVQFDPRLVRYRSTS